VPSRCQSFFPKKLPPRTPKKCCPKITAQTDSSIRLQTSISAVPAVEMSSLFTKPDGMSRTKWRTEVLDQVLPTFFANVLICKKAHTYSVKALLLHVRTVNEKTVFFNFIMNIYIHQRYEPLKVGMYL
jgi:hypothetical protein